MKTIMTSQVKDGMFLINKQAVQTKSEAPIIESIIETIVEPIIFKC
jgi:hypothetical protein